MNTVHANIIWDVAVIGGGPAGATAAYELARCGRKVLLMDRAGRIKPCGGAVPPRLLQDFAIPEHLVVAQVRRARMVAPSSKCVDMPIDAGFVGMVDREVFDEWLRERARLAGCVRMSAECIALERDPEQLYRIRYHCLGSANSQISEVRARTVIGADGAASIVARQRLPTSVHASYVAAYHEIVRTPPSADVGRCDIYYDGRFSPDFYGWVFPHGEVTSIGVGSARKGFSLRQATLLLRHETGLAATETLRREGAPIPLRPLRRWDDGAGAIVVGDAAGVVAPASGEGIYYAMYSARLAALSVDAFLTSGRVQQLLSARRLFMRAHGRVFGVLRLMQWFWYRSDARRERFVRICADPDVQRLTWQAYLNKRLVRAQPLAHARIFVKDMAHLLGLARV